MTDAACLFCGIAQRRVPAEIVAESQGLLAFNDIHPQAPTHLLIIPTEHIPTLAETTDSHTELLGEALHFANHLAGQYRLAEGGYRVVINCGAGAGQSVWHLHLHLLGGRPMRWPPG